MLTLAMSITRKDECMHTHKEKPNYSLCCTTGNPDQDSSEIRWTLHCKGDEAIPASDSRDWPTGWALLLPSLGSLEWDL